MDSFHKQLEEVTPRTALRSDLRILDPQETPAVLVSRQSHSLRSRGKERDKEILKRLGQGKSKKSEYEQKKSLKDVEKMSLSLLESNISNIKGLDQTYANISTSEESTLSESIDLRAVTKFHRMKNRPRRGLTQIAETQSPIIGKRKSLGLSQKGEVSVLKDQTYANITYNEDTSDNDSLNQEALEKLEKLRSRHRKALSKTNLTTKEWVDSSKTLQSKKGLVESLPSPYKNVRRSTSIVVAEDTYVDLSNVETSSDSISVEKVKVLGTKRSQQQRRPMSKHVSVLGNKETETSDILLRSMSSNVTSPRGNSEASSRKKSSDSVIPNIESTADSQEGNLSDASTYLSPVKDQNENDTEELLNASHRKGFGKEHEESCSLSTMESSLGSIQSPKKLKLSQKAPPIQLNFSSIWSKLKDKSVLESHVEEEEHEEGRKGVRNLDSVIFELPKLKEAQVILHRLEESDEIQLSPYKSEKPLTPPQSFRDGDQSDGIKEVDHHNQCKGEDDVVSKGDISETAALYVPVFSSDNSSDSEVSSNISAALGTLYDDGNFGLKRKSVSKVAAQGLSFSSESGILGSSMLRKSPRKKTHDLQEKDTQMRLRSSPLKEITQESSENTIQKGSIQSPDKGNQQRGKKVPSELLVSQKESNLIKEPTPLKRTRDSSAGVSPEKRISDSPGKVIRLKRTNDFPKETSPQKKMRFSQEKGSPQKIDNGSLKEISVSPREASSQKGYRVSPRKVSPQLRMSASPRKVSPLKRMSISPRNVSPQKRTRISPERAIPQSKLSVTPKKSSPSKNISVSSEKTTPQRRTSVTPRKSTSSSSEKMIVSSKKTTPRRGMSVTPNKSNPSKEMSVSSEKTTPQRRTSVTPRKSTSSSSKKMRVSSEKTTPQRRMSVTPNKSTPSTKMRGSIKKTTPQKRLSVTPKRSSPRKKISGFPKEMNPKIELIDSPMKVSPQKRSRNSPEKVSTHITSPKKASPLKRKENSPLQEVSSPSGSSSNKDSPFRKLRSSPRKGNLHDKMKSLNEKKVAVVIKRGGSVLGKEGLEMPNSPESTSSDRSGLEKDALNSLEKTLLDNDGESLVRRSLLEEFTDTSLKLNLSENISKSEGLEMEGKDQIASSEQIILQKDTLDSLEKNNVESNEESPKKKSLHKSFSSISMKSGSKENSLKTPQGMNEITVSSERRSSSRRRIPKKIFVTDDVTYSDRGVSKRRGGKDGMKRKSSESIALKRKSSDASSDFEVSFLGDKNKQGNEKKRRSQQKRRRSSSREDERGLKSIVHEVQVHPEEAIKAMRKSNYLIGDKKENEDFVAEYPNELQEEDVGQIRRDSGSKRKTETYDDSVLMQKEVEDLQESLLQSDISGAVIVETREDKVETDEDARSDNEHVEGIPTMKSVDVEKDKDQREEYTDTRTNEVEEENDDSIHSNSMATDDNHMDGRSTTERHKFQKKDPFFSSDGSNADVTASEKTQSEETGKSPGDGGSVTSSESFHVVLRKSDADPLVVYDSPLDTNTKPLSPDVTVQGEGGGIDGGGELLIKPDDLASLALEKYISLSDEEIGENLPLPVSEKVVEATGLLDVSDESSTAISSYSKNRKSDSYVNDDMVPNVTSANSISSIEVNPEIVNSEDIGSLSSQDDDEPSGSRVRKYVVDAEVDESNNDEESAIKLIPISVQRRNAKSSFQNENVTAPGEQVTTSSGGNTSEEIGADSSSGKASEAPKLIQMTMTNFLTKLVANPPKPSAVYDVKESKDFMEAMYKSIESKKVTKILKKKQAAESGLKTKKDNLPLSVPEILTKEIFEHYAKCKVDKNALKTIVQVSEKFWGNCTQDLMSIANSRGKGNSITKEDVVRLMTREGTLNDSTPLTSLVVDYLPSEEWDILIPTEYGNNRVYPPPKK